MKMGPSLLGPIFRSLRLVAVEATAGARVYPVLLNQILLAADGQVVKRAIGCS